MSVAKLAGRIVLVSALTMTLVPILGASPAFACSCRGGSDQEHYQRAEVVFKGTLRKTTPPKPRPDGLRSSTDPAVYEFLPSRVYKGEGASPTRVSSAVSGANCGLEISGRGPFLVFAGMSDKRTRAETGGAPLRASLCGGTRELGAKEKVPFGPGRRVEPAQTTVAGPGPR